MADKTKIEWADATWNPITGCSPVSEGCAHCYAARMVNRFPDLHNVKGTTNCGNFPHIHFHLDRLYAPLHWKRPRRIFVCSMGDLFHEQVTPDMAYSVFNIIRRCQQHTFIVLTKRPENIWSRLPEGWGKFGVFQNLWLGVTAENQEQADRRIPELLKIPAALHFVSVEPMLGPVDIGYALNGGPETNDGEEWHQTFRPLGWVICGAETGPGARHMRPVWVNDLRNQCLAARVPFFFKKWSDGGTCPSWREFPAAPRR